MIPLNQIQVASPCHESWSEMDGDGSVRFCSKCSRNVYNLSEMTAEQAQALVAEKEGRLCVRFYQRKDGTMITRDCPVGVRIARRRFVAALSWAASLAVASITGALRPAGAANASKASPPPAVVASMGDIAAPVKPHSPTPKPKPAVKPKAPKIPLKPMMGKIAMPPPRKPAPTALMGAAMPPPPSTKSGQ